MQEQINSCVHISGVYTALTTIKPPNKKSTGIYGEMIDELSKVGKVVGDSSATTNKYEEG